MSTVSRNHLPLYFVTPSHPQLIEKVESLNALEREALEKSLQTLAKEDGMRIEWWNTQWGKHHLFDCDGRLTRAFLQRLKDEVELQARCPPKIAHLVVEYSPFLNSIHWNKTTFGELVDRAQHLF